MNKTTSISIFWLRRDLRLDDNAALYHALKGSFPVLSLFIFDKEILDNLEDKDDARVTFIYNTLKEIKTQLANYKSSLLSVYDTPVQAWKKLTETYNIKTVYTNHDYEPYALQRDKEIGDLLKAHGIEFKTYKDHVIFEKGEVTKDDAKPYTVYTPYRNKWYQNLKPFYLKSYPTLKYIQNLFHFSAADLPTLNEMGFFESKLKFPLKEYENVIADYSKNRDYPAIKGTSHIGMHLRFGTISIRQCAGIAAKINDKTWLNELIWREFYSMILYHFPATVNHAFRPEFDRIQWRNNEQEFEAWCKGKTGFPLVDAGIRELNATGFMHNRVRMVVASFLTKDLLIDWRWGERYFARKLLDYELASNVGGWQWAAGSGTDATPYFRVFNPDSQLKKFDAQFAYIKKWVPEYADFSKYPKPIVDHAFARERCLKVFKAALNR